MNKQEVPVEEQPKKKKGSGKVAIVATGIATGVVLTHEVMTKGGWCKSLWKGGKALVNKFKSKDENEEGVLFETRQNRNMGRRDGGFRQNNNFEKR